MDGALTSIEKDNLVEYEDIIQKNFATFYEVGFALMQIKENKLYRESYPTFEAYCHEKWGFERNYANKLIRASSVVENLGTMVPIPASERTIRALTRLPAERQKEVYEKALETAPEGKVTAKHVEETVNIMTKKTARQPAKQPAERSLASDAMSCGSSAAVQLEHIRDDGPQDKLPNAMDLANAAINNLELIRDDDPRKEEALALVEEWIASSRQKDEAMAPCVPMQLFN